MQRYRVTEHFLNSWVRNKAQFIIRNQWITGKIHKMPELSRSDTLTQDLAYNTCKIKHSIFSIRNKVFPHVRTLFSWYHFLQWTRRIGSQCLICTFYPRKNDQTKPKKAETREYELTMKDKGQTETNCSNICAQMQPWSIHMSKKHQCEHRSSPDLSGQAVEYTEGLIQFRLAGGPEPFPAVIGREAGYTLDRSPVHHSATQRQTRQTTTHAHAHTHTHS